MDVYNIKRGGGGTNSPQKKKNEKVHSYTFIKEKSIGT